MLSNYWKPQYFTRKNICRKGCFLWLSWLHEYLEDWWYQEENPLTWIFTTAAFQCRPGAPKRSFGTWLTGWNVLLIMVLYNWSNLRESFWLNFVWSTQVKWEETGIYVIFKEHSWIAVNHCNVSGFAISSHSGYASSISWECFLGWHESINIYALITGEEIPLDSMSSLHGWISVMSDRGVTMSTSAHAQRFLWASLQLVIVGSWWAQGLDCYVSRKLVHLEFVWEEPDGFHCGCHFSSLLQPQGPQCLYWFLFFKGILTKSRDRTKLRSLPPQACT